MEDEKLTLAQWLAAAQSGDSDALGKLLDHHQSYLMLLARLQIGRRLQAKADPHDIVQETYLNAHRQFVQFRGHTVDEFGSWLRTILAGRIAQLVRRYMGTEARDIRLELSIECELDSSSRRLIDTLVSSTDSPRMRFEKNDQLNQLASWLEKLPPDYREVVLLRQVDELSFNEIAERMNRSVDSIQKLWVRGLEKLRQLMNS